MNRILLIWVCVLWMSGLSVLQAQQDSTGREFVQYKDAKNRVISEGYLVAGKPDGYWKTFYTSGQIKSEGNRENYLLTGIWLFYSEEGDTLESIDYRNDKKNGFHFKYEYETDKNGIKQQFLVSKELYLNDIKENKSFYYQHGKLFQEVNFVQGERSGLTRQFESDGRIVKLINYRRNVMISTETINQLDKKGLKTAVWKDFYPSGELHVLRNYLADRLDGIYREYTVQGQVIRTLRYSNGEVVISEDKKELPVKFHKEFYASGKVKKSGGFMGEVPVGLHQEFDESGKVVLAIVYSDYGVKEEEGLVDELGRKVGEWKEFWDDGALRAAGNYVEGKRAGKWKYFFSSGSLEQDGFYKDDKFSGNWKWYYDSGELWRDENYTKGIEDGEFSEFAREGSVIAQGVYEMGLKEGQWVMHSGDHIEKGEFREGLKEGRWKYYYSNEKIKFEGDFIQGQEDGKHLWYYENGNLKEERHYIFGSREKMWKRYFEDGILEMTITYRDNREYKINGKILEKREN